MFTGIKATIICPASKSHIIKYSVQDIYIFQESQQDYKEKTLPFLAKEQFSLDVSIFIFYFFYLC